AQVAELLIASSNLYADVLKSPIERVRVLAQFHKPQHVAVAGKLLSNGGTPAPYFHFLVLEGRPLDECHQLLTGFTNLVVQILGADRSFVRGGCWPIPPRYWAIGGTPASLTRVMEIDARAEAAKAA
ncbi:MAG: 4-oxalocrotonate tautomerase, partial [Proteobacteria bacterium]|nr:4-oxalocrotonate tautomerase [Pseudomonadota bacterium]